MLSPSAAPDVALASGGEVPHPLLIAGGDGVLIEVLIERGARHILHPYTDHPLVLGPGAQLGRWNPSGVSRVALKPSALLPEGDVLAIWAARLVEVEVMEGHLKSLKVALVIEAGFICSEKVALTLAPRETPFVPLAGLAVSTFGGVLSMLTVPGVGYRVPDEPAFLRIEVRPCVIA
jgi:hypothetical protein